MLIDTHSHLYAESLQPDLQDVIYRCKERNIKKILLPNIDLESIQPMKNLVESNPELFFPMMGLHPCSVDKNWKEVLKQIEQELYTGKYIAVGETGIDLYWDKSTFPMQELAFRQQIEWALDLDLPIVIHARESTAEILSIVQDYPTTLKGVFHCFSGDLSQAQEVAKRGMYIGIGGVLTFKNSDLKEWLSKVPKDKMVLETDSPYLAPVPHRGKRNESAYVFEIAQFLSGVLGISFEEVSELTSTNAQDLFQL